MWIAAVVAACATDDVASSGRGSGERDAAAQAGSCPGRVASSAAGVWARNPETSDCCQYSSLLAAPPRWPYFDTEAECRGSCRCSTLEGLDDVNGGYGTERTPLECRCSAEACPSSVAEAEQLLCSSTYFAVRLEGCGRVMIEHANGATGTSWTFERTLASADAGAAGERLIGGESFSDVPYGPCQTYEWIAGGRFECDDFSVCWLCGEQPAASSIPPCE